MRMHQRFAASLLHQRVAALVLPKTSLRARLALANTSSAKVLQHLYSGGHQFSDYPIEESVLPALDPLSQLPTPMLFQQCRAKQEHAMVQVPPLPGARHAPLATHNEHNT
eukprot:CAMPEP_0169422720 /NCGR_PEP_ID=MMETSP1017-20121227/67111_1 /TAXON_ID=342587 /ORGANISM="Karlodinium micrum, Strain CCMP2283" /LENGTH=109 /DNA_ID=CAMNT_0009532363 /DNA_START=792 /DNA_END=1121 /DNA_ORIENTATION=+